MLVPAATMPERNGMTSAMVCCFGGAGIMEKIR
jgi:hypothetical protein